MYIVVRLNPLLAKNVPQRNRAGVRVVHAPSVVDVNNDQLKILRGDQYIKICNFPSVAWFEAMGIERTQENEDSFRNEKGNVKTLTKENHKLSETARMAVILDNAGDMPQKATKTPSTDDNGDSKGGSADNTQKPFTEAGNDTTDASNQKTTDAKGDTVQTKGLFGKTIELSASSPKEELIKAIEKKRKKAGEDFNPESSPEALFAYLKTL